MKQYEEMALEIASKFASRMCDEYGETHGEYLFCMSIDDISHAIKLVTEKTIAAERNKVWTKEHWTEYERSIAAVEREACANLVDHILKEGGGTWGDAIRARGRDAA